MIIIDNNDVLLADTNEDPFILHNIFSYDAEKDILKFNVDIGLLNINCKHSTALCSGLGGGLVFKVCNKCGKTFYPKDGYIFDEKTGKEIPSGVNTNGH